MQRLCLEVVFKPDHPALSTVSGLLAASERRIVVESTVIHANGADGDKHREALKMVKTVAKIMLGSKAFKERALQV